MVQRDDALAGALLTLPPTAESCWVRAGTADVRVEDPTATSPLVRGGTVDVRLQDSTASEEPPDLVKAVAHLVAICRATARPPPSRGYKGVAHHGKRFVAHVYNGRAGMANLGTFDTALEGAIAYARYWQTKGVTDGAATHDAVPLIRGVPRASSPPASTLFRTGRKRVREKPRLFEADAVAQASDLQRKRMKTALEEVAEVTQEERLCCTASRRAAKCLASPSPPISPPTMESRLPRGAVRARSEMHSRI
jgi:hypothetical protein